MIAILISRLKESKFVIIFSLSFFFSFPFIVWPSAYDGLPADYVAAVQYCQQHIDSPTGWVPNYPGSGNKAVYTISGVPATDAQYGMKYDSSYGDSKDYLIVRSFAKSRYYTSSSIGVGNYTTHGSASAGNEASWVTTGKDATDFFDAQSATASTITKLYERGLGMNNDGSHDIIVEYALVPTNEVLMRPVKNPDIKNYSTDPNDYIYTADFPTDPPEGMSADTYTNFKKYFNYWQAGALGNWHTSPETEPNVSAFPWSEMGYTYFWGNGNSLDQIQGMSEFIILAGTTVKIYGIYSPQSYIYTRNDGTNFSTAAGSQYGNGFASFQITSTCDTVWAGNRFQKKVSSDSASPDQIIITSGGSISGGQGILVWSLNYHVNNSGSISGATTTKYGLTNSANIAILFKGDSTFGTAPAGSINRLTNSGTISSPEVAVQVDSGDTTINNTGTISGGTYAIYTSSSNDTVNITSGQVSGKIDLGGGTDTLTVNSATLGFTLDRDTDTTAHVTNVATANIANTSVVTIAPTIGGTKNVQDNENFLLVDATTLNTNTSNITIQNDSTHPMITFSLEKSGNQFNLIASRDNSYYQNNCGNSSLGSALDNLANNDNSDMAVVIGSLDGSGRAVNALQLQPNADNSTLQTSFSTQTKFINTIINHLDNFFTNKNSTATGISTGDLGLSQGTWAQTFDSYLNQDPRGSSNGYKANVWGFSGGYDKRFFNNFMLGVNAGYARNNVRTKDYSNRTDIDSYQVGFYANYAKPAYYLDGIFSFAYNQHDGSRNVIIGGINRKPTSNYGGEQYSTYFEGGYIFNKKKFMITPLTSLQYMHLHISSYDEKNADSIDLGVEAQDYDSLQSGIGIKLAYVIERKNCLLIPDFHTKWLYDYIADNQQATSTFTGGGAAFATNGFNPPKSSYNVGAKLTILTKQNFSVTFNYDCEFKSDFYSHSGYANMRYEF